MSWKCGACGQMDGRGGVIVDAVCHHCGKPLCREHQVEVWDTAFRSDKETSWVSTIHCAECRRNHPRIMWRCRKRGAP